MTILDDAIHNTGGTHALQAYQAYIVGCGASAVANLKAWATSWEHDMGGMAFPMPPAQVRDFIKAQVVQGRLGRPLKPQSIEHMLGYVSDMHVKVLGVADPTKHILVTSEMKALFREHGSRAKPITPLRLKGDVADLVTDKPLPGSIIAMLHALHDDDSGWALRARVVLGLGADTGRDRSDYARMDVGDVVDAANGAGHAMFSGTRTSGEVGEAPKFVSPDTMGFIREWLRWRKKAAPQSTAADTPMLVRIDQNGMPGGRLSVWGYVDVLKDIVRRVGGGAHVSGNSFQAGMKLDLAAIGTTKVGIANALGFKEL